MGRPKWFYEFWIRVWPLGKVANWLGSRPVIGSLLRPLFSPRDNRAVIIPVNQAVQGTESVVLPFSLLAPLVERASQRFVLAECICRQGERCRHYPRDLGCLFLGDGAAMIDPSQGRPVGVEEALSHARRAMEAGLVPLILHAAFDAYMLGIPFRRMLAVCFCCDCCCTVRQSLRLGPPLFWDAVLRLPGLTVTVGPECNGCGACLDRCYVQAISLDDGRVAIGERCKGCGRCVATCPVGAIRLQLAEEADVLGGLLALVDERTEIR